MRVTPSPPNVGIERARSGVSRAARNVARAVAPALDRLCQRDPPVGQHGARRARGPRASPRRSRPTPPSAEAGVGRAVGPQPHHEHHAARAAPRTEPASTSSPSGCIAIASSCAPGGPDDQPRRLAPKFGSRCPPGCSRATAKRCTAAERDRRARDEDAARRGTAPPSRAPARAGSARSRSSAVRRRLKLRSGSPVAPQPRDEEAAPVAPPTTVARPSPCSARADPARTGELACEQLRQPRSPQPRSRSPARAGRARRQGDEQQ